MNDKENNSNKSISHTINLSKNEQSIDYQKEKDNIIKSENKKIIDEYVIKETIGKGTFSTVKLGEHIKTKEKVAIKILNKEKIKATEDLVRIKREFKILSMMDHPNIIKTYKISENTKNYYIIMEYCDGGELFNYIVEKEKLDQNEASMFFYQLINALEYIHSLGIAHRDLKPENLLLVENKIIKIIDFGLSNYFNGEKPLETPCGSPSYASPEIIKGENYNGFSIDIWASGIIMFAMLCGYLPFDDDDEEEEEDDDEENDENNSDDNNVHHSNIDSDNSNNDSEKSNDNEILFQRILEGKLDFPSYLSKDSIDLMKKILVVDPEKRIEIKDIKKHNFYLLGQKNFLLNQKNISQHKSIKSLYKIEKTNKQNNKSKDIINNKDNKNINNQNNNNDKKIKKDAENIIKSLDFSINEKKNNNNNYNNIKLNEENKNEGNKNIIKKINKKFNLDEMEEYEKKLFHNYLNNINSIKKKNSIINKRLKKSGKRNKENKNNEFYYKLKTINDANPNNNFNLNKSPKKHTKNKNNYTLNELFIYFNPNTIQSSKIIVNSSLNRYNNNNKKKNKIPLTKLSPIVRKYDKYPINFNKNNNLLMYHNENTKSLNKDNTNLLTINIPEISSKRRNNTENKLINDIKYYITNGNNKNSEESNRNLKISKLISIDNMHDIYRVKRRKPILPIIKPNFFNIFNNSIINHNNDTSILNNINHIKTETANMNNQKRLITNGICFNNINNDMKYKLFYPKKSYNLSILKGAY